MTKPPNQLDTDVPDPPPSLDEALFLLGERKKELRFLNELNKTLLESFMDPEVALQHVVDALPAAMQFPDIACARITLPDRTYRSARFATTAPVLSEAIDLDDTADGQVEVFYRNNGGGGFSKDGLFLKEEREMLRNAASALSLFLRFHATEVAVGHAQERVSLLESVINHSPAIAFVWELTEGWPVAFVSENIDQFGYKAKAFKDGSVNYEDIVHPDDLSRVAKEVETYMSAGLNEFYQRYRIVTKSGAVRWVSDWTQVLRDDTGQAKQNQGIILDITNNLVTEEKAKRYLNTTGTMFVALDTDGRIQDLNEMSCNVLGANANELLGLDWFSNFIPDEEQEQLRDYHDQIVRGETARPIYTHENDIVTRTGRRIRVLWSNAYECDPEGRITSTISFGTDVTQARNDAVRAKAMALFPQQNPNPVLRIDSQGDVLLANAAALELIDGIAEGGPETRKGWAELINTARTARINTSMEITLGLKAVLFTIAPVEKEGYTNLYGMDVTREREQNRQLADVANSLPGALFRHFTHPDGSQEIRSMSAGCYDIWGLSSEEIMADPDVIFQMVHPEDRTSLDKSVQAAQRDLTEWRQDLRIVTHSGETKWVRGIGTPHLMSDGDIVSNVLVLDISNEKNAVQAAERALHATIGALASALEARDPYTAGHENRVADIAVKIAQHLGMNEKRLKGLELAAKIHDIGKIQVPAEILSKPTKLTAPEYHIIQLHPEVGANLLREVETEWPLADIVRQHHERYDGSGYPQGLAGEGILFEARILAVADTVEAMASHRPYRPGLGIAAAAEEIRQGAGIRYDPTVSNACIALIDAGKIVL